MTKIETDSVTVNKSQEEVFNFLKDFNHFVELLPEDRIENWSSDGKSCSFRIKGMAEIGMAIENTSEFDEINIVSHGKVPFPFKLDVYLQKDGENTTTANMIFSGEINAFMKMMIEKPLTNFFNMVIHRLAEIHK